MTNNPTWFISAKKWPFLSKIFHPFTHHSMSNSSHLLHKAASVLKVQLSRQAGRLVGTERELTLSFEKDDWGGWFAIIPSWPGPLAALAMVDGADTFLDLLSGGANHVTLDLSIDPKETWRELNHLRPHAYGDGAHYTYEDDQRFHRMWLCGVTEFVFGEMPERIWFKVS